jgi:hypothetical protein
MMIAQWDPMPSMSMKDQVPLNFKLAMAQEGQKDLVSMKQEALKASKLTIVLEQASFKSNKDH